AWEDHWTEPTIDQMLKPLKEHYQKALPTLMENILSFKKVKQKMVWHGSAWKWTIQYEIYGSTGKKNKVKDHFAYLVLNPDRPLSCIPLRPDIVDNLPLKNFHKYVREGVHGAKYGVNIHWCTWSPSAQTEVDYLTALLTHVY